MEDGENNSFFCLFQGGGIYCGELWWWWGGGGGGGGVQAIWEDIIF